MYSSVHTCNKKLLPAYTFSVAQVHNAQPLSTSVCMCVHVSATLRMLSHPQFPWLASTKPKPSAVLLPCRGAEHSSLCVCPLTAPDCPDQCASD